MIEINKIYNESCVDTLARISDKFVDLVITSPPYNMRTRISNGKYIAREKTKNFSKKYDYFSDDLPIDEFYSFHLFVLKELLRVSKIVCYNFQIVTGSKEAFFKIIGDLSTEIKDIIIWDKGNGQPAMHEMVLNSCYEVILILEDDRKRGRAIQNAKFKRGEMNNIFRIGRGEKIVEGHNAVFPEILVGELMKAFSKEFDLIYDPFMGSGTTAIVANKLNRNWIGSEITKEYFELANKRFEDHKKQLTLF